MKKEKPQEQIEKERKFLLKRLPSLSHFRTIDITQYYKDGYRYRYSYSSDTLEPIFEKIKKEKVSTGYNIEKEIEQIDLKEYYANRQGTMKDRSEISKVRFEYIFNGKKFEVDQFKTLNLIMMEVEDVELEEEINMPTEIKDVLLLEVTGNEKFDNFNLAK
jgi:CYTH domain-containing protein